MSDQPSNSATQPVKCLHLGCNEPAWFSPTRRSHWCLEHAWRFNRGDIVPNDAQAARLATWPDGLEFNSDWGGFPLEYVLERRARQQRVSPWAGWVNQCYRCDKPIVSRRKYCGRCRTELGLPETEIEPTIRCSNYGEPKPGRYLNDECLRDILVSVAMTPHGSDKRLCPPCAVRLTAMGYEWRKRMGFDF